MNISIEMKSILESQIVHENQNANLYLLISSRLKNKGMDEIGGFFKKESEGEMGHRKIIIDYLEDRNIDYAMLPIENIDYIWTNLTELGNIYLKKEQDTTEKIKNIYETACNDLDYLTSTWIQKLLLEQIEEENLAQTFLDCAILSENNINVFMRLFEKHLED